MKNRHAMEQRRQAKLAREKIKSRTRSATRRAKQENKVSRTADITHVESQLAALDTERKKIAADHDLFRAKISAQIEKILRDADVWDLIQTLEKGREDRRVKDQGRADEIGVKMDELSKIHGFLMHRAKEEAAAAEAAALAAEREARAALPPEYINGINVSPLDTETRLMVMNGNQDTIAALRLNPALVEPEKAFLPPKEAKKSKSGTNPRA